MNTGIFLKIRPETLAKLAPGSSLWKAAHADGAENRINADTVLEAASYGAPFGVIAAVSMWIRKKFRNRGKTARDLAAEKEALSINQTCAALTVMLREYLTDAQEGRIDPEAIGELTETLAEMRGYYREGKLAAAGTAELAEIAESIRQYTAALAESLNEQPAATPEGPDADAFSRILDQLDRQTELASRL